MRALAASGLVLLVLTTGCGGATEPAAKPRPSAPATTAGSITSNWRANEETQGGFYRRDLGKVSPGLDDDRSLDQRARRLP